MKRTELPDQGFVFWPVGTGDSTTVLVNHTTVIQIDLNHLQAAESEEDKRWPVIHELIELLPWMDGKPYLAALIVTHADEDHCRGFKELLREHDVLIGELWFTPRLIADINNEKAEDLSEDAQALRDEALRRVQQNAHSPALPRSGDRIRVIGYHESLQDEFADLPHCLVSPAGTIVEEVDGVSISEELRVFVHSPFKEYMEDDERNRSSIGVHMTLKPGGAQALLLGDLDYRPIKQLLQYTTNRWDKEWNVLLAPHHCSKSVMYERENGKDVLRQDVLDLIEDAKASDGSIVASSDPIPSSNSSGDNPPHAKAKNRYQEICNTFVCTGEHADKDDRKPVIFEATSEGIRHLGAAPVAATKAAEQIRIARGGNRPASQPVGFGEC